MFTSYNLPEKIKKPPEVTAEVWCIYDPITKAVIGSKKENYRKEIASLTKIMTFIVVIEIADEYDISLNTVVNVPKIATKIKGTTSNLEDQDQLKVIDLLYGMMLPSGNDSALTLAIYFGRFYHDSMPLIGFVRVMNYMCDYLDLKSTFFKNPHGLSAKPNISTAHDISVIASYGLKNKLFRDIVITKTYSCEINNLSSGSRILTWHNTNKLLSQGFNGIKTGTTELAGPCLCARISDPITPFIITVLNSSTSDDRWQDVLDLANWAKKIAVSNI
jgi:serine-type D-Ala-D-Ala carboxypeptidase (penicillin-binding protein 5/6)